MYSHRIIAFIIFTSLFFISSSLFAGLTWFLFSLRTSSASPADDLHYHDATVSTRPAAKGDDETVRATSHADDDLTISPSVVARRPFPRYSSSTPISHTYSPATEISAREGDRQSHKPRLPSESSTSGHSKDEELSSTMTHVKTDDDLTSFDGQDDDDDVETIE